MIILFQYRNTGCKFENPAKRYLCSRWELILNREQSTVSALCQGLPRILSWEPGWWGDSRKYKSYLNSHVTMCYDKALTIGLDFQQAIYIWQKKPPFTFSCILSLISIYLIWASTDFKYILQTTLEGICVDAWRRIYKLCLPGTLMKMNEWL